MTTYPNQRKIIISKGQHKTTVNIDRDALYAACQDLSSSELRLWIYLADNQDEFELYLYTNQIEKKVGMKKGAYHRAFDKLIEKSYIVPNENSKNVFKFYQFGEYDSDHPFNFFHQ